MYLITGMHPERELSGVPANFDSFGLPTKAPYTIMLRRRWLRRWGWCLFTPVLTTGLNVETSYLRQIYTNIPYVCTSNIQ